VQRGDDCSSSANLYTILEYMVVSYEVHDRFAEWAGRETGEADESDG